MRRFLLPLLSASLWAFACPSSSEGEGEGEEGEGEGEEGKGEEGEGEAPIDNDFGFTIRTPSTHTLPCDDGGSGACPGGTFDAPDVDYVCTFVHDDVSAVVYLRATPTSVEAVFFPLPIFDDVSAFVSDDGSITAVDGGYDWGGNHHNDAFFIVVDGVRYNFSHSSFGFGFRACQPPDCLQIEDGDTFVDGCGPDRSLPIACVDVADPLPDFPTSFEKCLGDPNK